MEVTEIWRYVIKSCVGTSLGDAEIDDSGLVGDRLCVVATAEGKVVSQRTAPELNLVSATISGQQLRVTALGHPDLILDLLDPGTPTTVQLYDGPAPAHCMGSRAAEWFTRFLGGPCRLLRSLEKFVRRMEPQVAHLFLKEQRRFPDCAPLHLLGRHSLEDLNARLDQPISMSRFRPNLVVDAIAPYAEDQWRVIKVGDITLDYMGPCERCAVTLVAPGSAERGKEPLRTLNSYRKMRQGFDSRIAFGAFFKPRRSGDLRVGDRLDILEAGNPLGLIPHTTYG